MLAGQGLEIQKIERVAVNEHGQTYSSTHIYALTTTNHVAEVNVRTIEERGKKRTCDTFGDQIKGLNIQELERVLKENPAARFLHFFTLHASGFI